MMQTPSQVSKLQKQIQALDQELATLQTTAQVSRNEWAALKKRIAKDTQVTIEASKKAIAEATTKAKKELAETDEKLAAAKENLVKRIDHSQTIQNALEKDMERLERDKRIAQQLNADLSNKNQELASTIKVHQDELSGLKTAEAELRVVVDDLTITELGLNSTIEQHETKFENICNEIARVETELTQKSDELNKDVSILELKKQSLAQEIVENRVKDEKVRENLANWQTKLDEKDKNLRIREARVNEQEKSIARNYNLLNL